MKEVEVLKYFHRTEQSLILRALGWTGTIQLCAGGERNIGIV